jgi:anti-sigma regulatory factor (Ser/Thr protein kinase)
MIAAARADVNGSPRATGVQREACRRRAAAVAALTGGAVAKRSGESGVVDVVLDARNLVADLLEGAPEERIDTARLVVSELVTNAVLHARLGPGGEVGVRAVSDGAMFYVEVCDKGVGFEHAAPSPSSGGLGLVIIEAVADKWGIDRDAGSTKVWVRMSLADTGSAQKS